MPRKTLVNELTEYQAIYSKFHLTITNSVKKALTKFFSISIATTETVQIDLGTFKQN